VEPFDLAELEAEILGLKHRDKRTQGTGELYRRHWRTISRRALQALVRKVREELKATRRAMQRRIEWKAPALIWSVDDAELGRDGQGEKVMLHNVHDLSSRYKLSPVVGPMLSGEEVAGHLEGLFIRHGAPLVLKRDNGSNLNHREVDRVLQKYLVIPLNSPPRYPPYNGGIEESQGEMKRGLAGVEKKNDEDRDVYGALRAHELNHMRRRSLHGAIACTVFSAGKQTMKEYGIRKRKEAYEEIRAMAAAAVEALRSTRRWKSDSQLAAAAWRRAVETWLQGNGMIKVSQPRKVSPYFHELLVS
jgi:transposase InsO family protein